MDIVSEINDFNNYQRALEELSLETTQASNKKRLVELLDKFQHLLDDLGLKFYLLRSAVERAPEDELAFVYENFTPVIFPIVDDIRQTILETSENEPLLEWFDGLELSVSNLVERQASLQLSALKAWRKQNPRFSSMGIIDTDIQSNTLKDAKKLARR